MPLGAGEDAVPGPGRDKLFVYRALFRDTPGDKRPPAKTPGDGGQDGPR